ncbi:hypothetical protein ACFY00_37445 [Kitasatospora sp. NPDC001540]|uniref:hypothetical protein n=1 Tax=Kitasatospora sp. NPDC001540 TaxID=3364014 RepID=UPI0036BC3400
MKRRLKIHDNLVARIEEAKCEGWLGDVEGLEIHLAGATQKLAQLDAEADRKQQAINLGMPSFLDSAAVKTATP